MAKVHRDTSRMIFLFSSSSLSFSLSRALPRLPRLLPSLSTLVRPLFFLFSSHSLCRKHHHKNLQKKTSSLSLLLRLEDRLPQRARHVGRRRLVHAEARRRRLQPGRVRHWGHEPHVEVVDGGQEDLRVAVRAPAGVDLRMRRKEKKRREKKGFSAGALSLLSPALSACLLACLPFFPPFSDY